MNGIFYFQNKIWKELNIISTQRRETKWLLKKLHLDTLYESESETYSKFTLLKNQTFEEIYACLNL